MTSKTNLPLRGQSLDLFAQPEHPGHGSHRFEWPKADEFPLNLGSQRVQDSVLKDLHQSRNPLLVVGYASLDRIIDFVAQSSDQARLRLLFGNEPFSARRESFELRTASFPKEVEKYWLQRGISLRLSAKLIQCLERLQSGHTQARYIEDLHAKIYCGEEAATVGSSNFTQPGMERQFEANARFTKRRHRHRFEALVQIAENYWQMGENYTQALIALLEKLLRWVSWQEALARACAELLEGDWAKAYWRNASFASETQLWPSQKQGIAQALYILSHQGSVLVADTTGSGKTRMGVHLIGALMEDILSKGRIHRGKALMICPPAVLSNWEWESNDASVALDIHSHGSLSHPRSQRRDLTMDTLRRAQILCVDEGHNFLNLGSSRTQNILRHMADHVLLFTATPINRSVKDLLRIVDLLGADNLEPVTQKIFKRLLGARHIRRSFSDEEVEILRKEIQRFTVRRTKDILNGLIEREPEQYRDKYGNLCRFPRHNPQIYTLNESQNDREIARRIRGLASELYGVTHFLQPVELPETLKRAGVSEEQYLTGRLGAANKLAGYQIMACLRSSRAALAEHIVGTRQAAETFALDRFRKQHATGNILAKLDRNKGRIPVNRLSIPLPPWLADQAEHAKACEHDQAIYRQIYRLLAEMSDGREVRKAEIILQLMDDMPKDNRLLLAFDSKLISLAEIERQIQRLAGNRYRVIIATGDQASGRRDVLNCFSPGSRETGIIGLCSDSLSEGVNLQQAATLLHLDMPTVVRIAEQRAGRIDRLDSPHREIAVWWPQDAPEFALSSDERFLERYETVEVLLGSNMPLPVAMQSSAVKPVDVTAFIQEVEKKRDTWDGIQDAFAPVRMLVSGDQALLDEATYEHYRRLESAVLSRVSVVQSNECWAFLCLKGCGFGAPRWVFLSEGREKPVTDLEAVCRLLRSHLHDGVKNLPPGQKAAGKMNQFLEKLGRIEIQLLSRKKQRALEEMKLVLEAFVAQSREKKNQPGLDGYLALLDLFKNPNPFQQPDWHEVAARWLDIIRPVWYEKLKQKRRKPLLLRDIRADIIEREEYIGPRILEEFQQFPLLPSADERIIACILGLNQGFSEQAGPDLPEDEKQKM